MTATISTPLLCAHATVVDRLRRGECLAVPVPDSLTVLAELRRAGVEMERAACIRACRELRLPLADMPCETKG